MGDEAEVREVIYCMLIILSIVGLYYIYLALKGDDDDDD